MVNKIELTYIEHYLTHAEYIYSFKYALESLQIWPYVGLNKCEHIFKFSDHSAIKQEIGNKIPIKYLNIWKLRNTLLNNP